MQISADLQSLGAKEMEFCKNNQMAREQSLVVTEMLTSRITTIPL